MQNRLVECRVGVRNHETVLPVLPKAMLPPGLSPGKRNRSQSVFTEMQNKSVVSYVYRSPAKKTMTTGTGDNGDNGKSSSADYFAMDYPVVASNTQCAASQTDLSLGISQNRVSWKTEVVCIEETVTGSDAKIGLAMRAQEQDVLPEVHGPVSEDGDSSNAEDNTDNNDGAGDCSDGDSTVLGHVRGWGLVQRWDM